MYEESSSSDICNPILTLDELLNNRNDKLHWGDKVEPLVIRSSPISPSNSFYSMDSDTKLSSESRPKVLVVHDYKGNYLDDKFINGGLKWQDYRFYNWSVVDIFCYFSHNLFTIPTLQYLNAAHRNGVKVIGTLIFEHDEGRKAIYNMLANKEQTEKVANALVEIAKRLGFEGWLLNVEVSVSPEMLPMLKYFAQLMTIKTREEIKNGLILWYDSVSALDGILHGQSELNSENEAFFDLCDGIVTDYKWKEEHVERTSNFINENYPQRRQDVFFGIDIFGRGQTAGFRTSETLAISAAKNFSTSIFAPGWTMEHINARVVTDEYSLNREFLVRNDQFWTSLYKYFYIYGPKTLPFITNFCIGSGRKMFEMGRKVKGNWFNMKEQAFHPSMPSSKGHFSHYFVDGFSGGSSLSLETNDLFRIYTCELPCQDDLIFSFTFKKRKPQNDVEIHLNLLNIVTNLGVTIVCKKVENNPNVIPALNAEEARAVSNFLAYKEYSAPPIELTIGWETQYFLLKFDKGSSNNIIITDIGVKKIEKGTVLLGQIAFYPAAGIESDSMNVKKIEL